MASPTRRASSLRKPFEKISSSFHFHRDGSFSPPKPASPAHRPSACHDDEEVECLKALRAELQNRGIEIPQDMIYAGDLDSTLMRFARARKYDIEKIVLMIENTLKWRAENKVDQILIHPIAKEKLAIIRKSKPASYIGFDKKGKPVYVDRLGKLDVKSVEQAGLNEEDMIYYHIQEMEYMGRVLMKEAAERVGHTVDQVAMIMDVEGVSLTSFTAAVKSLTKKLLSIDSDNYPETNGGTWIVNASYVFSTIWRFVQPFLDVRTRQKITVCPNNARTRAMLVETFGKELLPTFLGGDVDFEECRVEWAAKMDAVLLECQRQHKETGILDTYSIAMSNSKRYPNGQAPADDDKEQIPTVTSKAGLTPLLVRQPSSMDEGDEYYTPRSTLSRASSTVSSFDADSVLTPDGVSMSEARKNMTPSELSAALQGLVKDDPGVVAKQGSMERVGKPDSTGRVMKQDGSGRMERKGTMQTTLEPIADEASEDPRITEEMSEQLLDEKAQHAAHCKCCIQ